MCLKQIKIQISIESAHLLFVLVAWPKHYLAEIHNKNYISFVFVYKMEHNSQMKMNGFVYRATTPYSPNRSHTDHSILRPLLNLYIHCFIHVFLKWTFSIISKRKASPGTAEITPFWLTAALVSSFIDSDSVS